VAPKYIAIVRSCLSLAPERTARKIGVPAAAAERLPNGSRFEDCKAFVAGASKGLGKAAQSLGRRRRSSSSVRAMCRAQAGGGGDWRRRYSAADVSRPDEVKRVVAEAIAPWASRLPRYQCRGPPTAPSKRPRWRLGYRVSAQPDECRSPHPRGLRAEGFRRGRIVNLTGYGVKSRWTIWSCRIRFARGHGHGQDHRVGSRAIRHHRNNIAPVPS